MNLLIEVVAATRDEQMRTMQQATSLRTLAQALRAKSEDLRRRNSVLQQKAEAANRHYFEVSNKIFGATKISEVEFVHVVPGSTLRFSELTPRSTRDR